MYFISDSVGKSRKYGDFSDTLYHIIYTKINSVFASLALNENTGFLDHVHFELEISFLDSTHSKDCVFLFLTSLLLQPFMHYIKSVHFNYVVWVYWTLMGFFS